MLALNEGDPALEAQVEQWRQNPFNPHLIARLRPVAYQKYVVMKYIDNLIAWGDSLFGRDTIESINTATLLYVLASSILGPRPETLPETSVEDNETYNSLADRLDTFSTPGGIENQVPAPDFTSIQWDQRPVAYSRHILFLLADERATLFLLDHGRRSTLQDSSLHEH